MEPQDSLGHTTDPILSQMNPVYIMTYFFKISLILSTHLCLGIPDNLFPSGFATKSFYAFCISSVHTTCPNHLILLDLTTLIISGEE